MKSILKLASIVLGAALLTLGTSAFAANGGKEKTITGEAKCAKCALKQSEKCQTVVETQGKNGKKVVYYLEDNDVAKGFHKNVCSEPKKVTVTGKAKKSDGKHELVASKIEIVK
jgi:hypothetical protein